MHNVHVANVGVDHINTNANTIFFCTMNSTTGTTVINVELCYFDDALKPYIHITMPSRHEW